MKRRLSLLIAAGVVAIALPSYGRITKTRPSASSTTFPGPAPSPLAPLAPLVFSLGVEYQEDPEQAEYGFPMLMEYNVTEKLKLILEQSYVSIVSKSAEVPSVRGFGDLETAVDYEFLRERRYRPALALEARVKWPTAEDPDLGDPGTDYTFGLIASKDLVYLDLDLNVLYTFVGDREEDNTVEVSLAAEWHVNRYVDLIAEVANVTRIENFRGAANGVRDETEATVGLGWQINRHLRMEQGIVLKERGEWELLVGWEWNFGGD